METFLTFLSANKEKLLQQVLEHLTLTFLSVLLALLIALPLGILISKHKKWASAVLGISGILQTIPSLALLGILIPIFGIGFIPALFALSLYALMPIIRNTYTGLTGVDPTVLEAARAMGMSNGQRLLKIELPLAMPVILAGIRSATVINVGVATLAAYVGAGGLGEFIFGGISLNNPVMMLAGAIPAAALALLLDFLLSIPEKVSYRLHKRSRPWIISVCIMAPLLIFLSGIFRVADSKGVTLLAGFTPEFIGRSDGYQGIVKKYGFRLRNLIINDAVMYQAIFTKKLDIISGYSTDGRLKSYNLVILNDDKHIFPPYYAAPVIRRALIRSHPEIQRALDLLSGKISDAEMTAMNYKVDFQHRSPEQVAKEFLLSKGLYRSPGGPRNGTITIGAKIFGEQQILINMYSMLILGNTGFGTLLKPNLGGTEIVFNAIKKGAIDLYPEYTGTGLLVILQPPLSVSTGYFADKDRLYTYVKDQFMVKYGLVWLKPEGFNNSYALMMRKDQASSLHIQNISDLQNYGIN